METAALGAPLAQGRTAEVFAWDDGYVLKLFRSGWGAESAAHEAEVTRVVNDSGAPAPRVGELAEVAGRFGVVYERVEGPSLLRMLLAQPARLPVVARLLAETHAGIHQHTAPGLPRIHKRQTHRIQAAPGLTLEARGAALRALEALPDGATLCHGDYHMDNVLLSSRGPLVIDWENAALGDPHADIARTLLLLRAGFHYADSPTERLMRKGALVLLSHLYLRRYHQLRPLDMERLRAWELPVTAARLSEKIREEEAYLLGRVRRLTATS
jgi:aminoglycoside phosphotransferase (APT) family kinase protein